MKKVFFMFVVVSLGLAVTSQGFPEGEGQGHKDIPHFSGMPNYTVTNAADKEFDEYRFFDGKKVVPVEGKKWAREYQLKEGAKQASDLQISRNYANAVKSIGGIVLFEGMCISEGCEDKGGYRRMFGKITKGVQELWVEVTPFNDGYNYNITVVEKEAMKQDVTARDILTALNTDGYIALYINFDTAKAIIKPESQPVIDQIASMMRANPDLKIAVEGHTDSAGDPQKNKTLSEERARSVVDALVKEGVDAKRLSAAGYGQDRPIADNRTEEGRAKNRRVELVKK